MIATRTTLPAATPRLEQATSPQAANTLPDNQHTFQRALSQNQHNERLRDSSRTREPSPREVEARRQPQGGDNDRSKADAKDDDGHEKAEIRSVKPAVSEGQSVDAAVEVDAAAAVQESTPVSMVVKDPEPTAPAAPIAFEPVQGLVEEGVANDASTSEESESEIALAQVVAVAAQLVEQATRSIASAQDVTATAGTTGEAVVMIESNKPKAAVKADVAVTMQVAVEAEDSILTSVASSQGAGNQAAVTDQHANLGQGSGQQPPAQTPAPAAANAATAPKAELSGGAIPIEASGGGAAGAGQGGPAHGPVSESISAQVAQLSRDANADGNEEVNMGRLTRGLQSAINQRGGSVTLRLTPPELGAVRIEMAVRDGVVNAKFTAQTESVRNLLMDQMGQLRQAMDRQGLSVDKIEVQVAQQSPGGSFAGSDRQADDMGRDGRSAGQYASQGDKGGQGEPGERGRDPRPAVDSFERVMADVQ